MEVEVKIAKNSPNYDKIVNFLYEDSDIISDMLISCFRDYILDNKLKNKKKFDEIMNLYTDKGDFYRFVQSYYKDGNENDIFDSYDRVYNKLLKLFQMYEEEKMKKIDNTRWL